MGGNERRNGPAKHAVLRLDNRHAAPARGERRGDFQSDKPAAQHDDVAGIRRMVADGAGVGDACAAKRRRRGFAPASGSARGREPGARIRRSKPSCAPSSKVEPPGRLVDRRDAFAEAQTDIVRLYRKPRRAASAASSARPSGMPSTAAACDTAVRSRRRPASPGRKIPPRAGLPPPARPHAPRPTMTTPLFMIRSTHFCMKRRRGWPSLQPRTFSRRSLNCLTAVGRTKGLTQASPSVILGRAGAPDRPAPTSACGGASHFGQPDVKPPRRTRHADQAPSICRLGKSVTSLE